MDNTQEVKNTNSRRYRPNKAKKAAEAAKWETISEEMTARNKEKNLKPAVMSSNEVIIGEKQIKDMFKNAKMYPSASFLDVSKVTGNTTAINQAWVDSRVILAPLAEKLGYNPEDGTTAKKPGFFFVLKNWQLIFDIITQILKILLPNPTDKFLWQSYKSK